MAKVEKIVTKAEAVTPNVEFEWFKYLDADKFGKHSVKLVFKTQEDVAAFNKAVLEIVEPFKAELAKKTKMPIEKVRVRRNYFVEHYKWDKNTKTETPTGRGQVMLELSWDAFEKSGERAPQPIVANGVGEDGKLKLINCKVSNGSVGRMKYTVNLCGEKTSVEKEDGTTEEYVRAFSSIKPIGFNVENLIEYSERVTPASFDQEKPF